MSTTLLTLFNISFPEDCLVPRPAPRAVPALPEWLLLLVISYDFHHLLAALAFLASQVIHKRPLNLPLKRLLSSLNGSLAKYNPIPTEELSLRTADCHDPGKLSQNCYSVHCAYPGASYT